ncbi:DUF805 domain-containing protein [Novosphingobium clariflavum]|uniref:DUF805 domain-containing protein n=1 Tax=Novosphingobium clariflavum TaxID=2029884 RepID=A0ABV6S323_9SPHN|nr:DUF805 domain-containing protein [Novosphingobium clariflavum]
MIGYHLVRLAKFSGREGRAKFWPWAGVVVGLVCIGSFAAIGPMMVRSMAKMQQYAREHPEQATVTSGPGHYEISIQGHHPELMPDFSAVTGAMEIVMAVAIVLLAAAVTRRLHDTGKAGTWGLLPLPFLVIGFTQMPRIFAAPEPDMRLFGLLFLNNLFYLGALGVLILLLAGAGSKGDNRYGPPPQD